MDSLDTQTIDAQNERCFREYEPGDRESPPVNWRKLARLSVIAAVAVLMGSAGFASDPESGMEASLQVFVSGDSGPMSNVRLVIKERRTSERGRRVGKATEGVTDSNGRFTTMLPPGSYQVTATLRGWMPVSGLTLIKRGQRKPLTVRLLLRYPDCHVVQCAV